MDHKRPLEIKRIPKDPGARTQEEGKDEKKEHVLLLGCHNNSLPPDTDSRNGTYAHGSKVIHPRKKWSWLIREFWLPSTGYRNNTMKARHILRHLLMAACLLGSFLKKKSASKESSARPAWMSRLSSCWCIFLM